MIPNVGCGRLYRWLMARALRPCALWLLRMALRLLTRAGWVLVCDGLRWVFEGVVGLF